jgi:hypothetical protein
MGIGYRPFRPRQMETQCQPPSETAVAGLQESARAREPEMTLANASPVRIDESGRLVCISYPD